MMARTDKPWRHATRRSAIAGMLIGGGMMIGMMAGCPGVLEPPPDPCAVVSCAAGETCTVVDGSPVCLRPSLQPPTVP